MGVNKVQGANGEVYIDISQDTVTPETLARGYTATNASGEKITGTMNPSSSEWHEIENKPFTEFGEDTLTWSGDVTDMSQTGIYYKVSDVVLQEKEMSLPIYYIGEDGEQKPVTWWNYEADEGIYEMVFPGDKEGQWLPVGYLIVKAGAYLDTSETLSATFDETGIYLPSFRATKQGSIFIDGFGKFPPHKCVLNPESLPENEELPTTAKDIFGAIGEVYETSRASYDFSRTAYDVATEAKNTINGVNDKPTYCSQGLAYTLSEDETYYTVGVGTCKDTEVIIPATYKGKPVSNIGQYGFVNCTWITKVMLPSSINSITGSGFSGCSALKSINIPKGVTFIGYWAFLNCSAITIYCEVETKPSTGWNSYWNPDNRPVVWGCKFTFGELNEKINTMSGGNSSTNGLEMPQIRFGSAIYTNIGKIVDDENPLKLMVEIVGGGPLQVGDMLQICVKRTYGYKKGNLTSYRKQKLRQQCSYYITQEDIGKRFISISTEGEVAGWLFKNDRNSTTPNGSEIDTLSAFYLRIKRPIYKETSDGYVPIDAKFSNIITVWKTYNLNTNQVSIK